jgi:hypothetical protein
LTSGLIAALDQKAGIGRVIVICWEGQNPRLQAKALAFFSHRLGPEMKAV